MSNRPDQFCWRNHAMLRLFAVGAFVILPSICMHQPMWEHMHVSESVWECVKKLAEECQNLLLTLKNFTGQQTLATDWEVQTHMRANEDNCKQLLESTCKQLVGGVHAIISTSTEDLQKPNYLLRGRKIEQLQRDQNLPRTLHPLSQLLALVTRSPGEGSR